MDDKDSGLVHVRKCLKEKHGPLLLSATQPFFVSSRNAPQGGALRDDAKNGRVAD